MTCGRNIAPPVNREIRPQRQQFPAMIWTLVVQIIPPIMTIHNRVPGW